jgi:hypothetical protein
MSKHQLKGICYNRDEKYFWGHKCNEKNIFMVISEDIYEEDGDVSTSEALPQADDPIPPSNPP